MAPLAEYRISRLRPGWWNTYVWSDSLGQYLPVSFAYSGAAAIARFDQRSRFKA